MGSIGPAFNGKTVTRLRRLIVDAALKVDAAENEATRKEPLRIMRLCVRAYRAASDGSKARRRHV